MEVTHAQTHATEVIVGGGQFIESQILQDPVMFSLLSKDIYAKPVLATVREIICNAWDAHIEAGLTDKPIEIILNEEDLIIRDFGSGIPDEDIQIRYLTFGSSTKRAKKKVTGGFGLGAKAPWAYTNMFDVTSYCEGTMTLYNIIKSHAPNGGAPGAIPVVQIPTTETGLKVHVRLKKPTDTGVFKNLIEDVVYGGGILATLNGTALPRLNTDEATHPWVIANFAAAVDMTRYDSFDTTSIYVKVGNVLYRVDTHLVSKATTVRRFINGLYTESQEKYSLVLLAQDRPIIPLPNREELNYNEKNIELLNELCDEFIKVCTIVKSSGLKYLSEILENMKQAKDGPALLNIGHSNTRYKRSCITLPDVLTTPEQVTQCYYNNHYPHTPETIQFELEERFKILSELNLYPQGHLKQIFKYLRQYFTVQGKHSQIRKEFLSKKNNNFLNYIKKHILRRHYRDLSKSKLFKTNLLRVTNQSSNSFISPVYYFHRVIMYHLGSFNFDALLKPEVIFTARKNVEDGVHLVLSAINRNQTEYEKRIPKETAYVYQAPLSKKHQQELVALFESAGFIVHDWCGYKEWMPKQLAPTKKLLPLPTVPGATALPAPPVRTKPTGFAILSQSFCQETRLYSAREARKTDKPRIDNPLCYIENYSASAQYSCMVGLFSCQSNRVMERFGDKIAIVGSDAEKARVLKLEIPTIDQYIVDWALNQAESHTLKAFWEYNLAYIGSTVNVPNPTDNFIAFLLSPRMLKAVGYPYKLTEDDLDALRFLHAAIANERPQQGISKELTLFWENYQKIQILPFVLKTAKAFHKSSLATMLRVVCDRYHKLENYGSYTDALINHFMKETHNV